MSHVRPDSGATCVNPIPAGIGDADEVLAGGALNLAAGELSFALQWLIAVGTIELEFACAHGL